MVEECEKSANADRRDRTAGISGLRHTSRRISSPCNSARPEHSMPRPGSVGSVGFVVREHRGMLNPNCTGVLYGCGPFSIDQMS